MFIAPQSLPPAASLLVSSMLSPPQALSAAAAVKARAPSAAYVRVLFMCSFFLSRLPV